MSQARVLALFAVLAFSTACASTDKAPDSAADAKSDGAAAGDIVAVAEGAGSFKTLDAALKAADLVDTLKGDGPFTVVAPTDEAFAKLPAGTVDDLLKPENKEKLKAVLTYDGRPCAPAARRRTLRVR